MTNTPILSTLRRFTARRESEERCELCSAGIADRHRHVLDLQSRQIACTCDACAFLLSSQEGVRFRRIPTDVRFLADVSLTDAQWHELAIPIELAFFFSSTSLQRVVALYPSPAGAVESLLTLDRWTAIVDANPVLRTMQPDVEALLVNRVARPAEIFIAPIDECYRLVGLIRANWRGFSGGAEMKKAVSDYFLDLKARAHA
jgi:hypothetical protein